MSAMLSSQQRIPYLSLLKRRVSTIFILMVYSFFLPQTEAQDSGIWWLEKPMRVIQTNLREIDATLDPDAYIEDVLACHADVILINVGGIVANYPTDLPFHFQNPFMKDDLVGALVERAHNAGLRVIGRFDFSKLNETLAAKKPEWLYKSVKGEVVNYNGQVHTCLNGGYQQEYLFKILDEALERYPVDGLYFNMSGYQTSDYSGNYHGICQCDACKKRFHDASGLKLPTREDRSDPVFRRYDIFRRDTTAQLFNRIRDFIRSKGEHIAVCTWGEAGVDVVRYESNSSLDRKLPQWNYSASDQVKRSLGSWKNKASSNITIQFVDFGYRHAAVAPWLNELRMAENIVNGGWLDYCVIGHLDNQEDRSSLDTMRDIYQFHANNERWFTGTEPVSDVCLVRQDGPEYRGLFRILSENHILFDVIEKAALEQSETPRHLESYPIVILPDVRSLSNAFCARLDAYVEGGGRLLSTGMTATQEKSGSARSTVGLKAAGLKPGWTTYSRQRGRYFKVSTEDKTVLGGTLLENLELVYVNSETLTLAPEENTKALLRFIPDAMYGPPEKSYYKAVTDTPGLFIARSGEGVSVYIPWLIGSHYEERSNHVHNALIMSVLDGPLALQRGVTVQASPLVEMTRHANVDKNFEWIGLVNHSGQLGTAFHPSLPIHDIKLTVRSNESIRAVRLLRAKKTLDFSAGSGGQTTITIPELDRFEVVLLEYE
jgi:hypothetical protein